MPFERRDGYMLWVGGPLPKGADGFTLGKMIIVRHGKETSTYLLRHELVHVRQWRRYGVLGFSARYIGAYAWGRMCRHGHRGAYLRIPLEIEADWIARRSVSTAVREVRDPEVAAS